ncbi:ABC transporter permease [Nitratireductor pacificus]|uniref:Putative glutathione transporter n=1 Tax=Nitratireductor pacificus pht-3B TaxID=391937 RepID=K2LIC4_9HYPH|nr:ABC transporter permease [Nitratireductor pacificus]EKF17504.1 Putative glutathione transporter [Nitratireductor pacificus pht-3B]
MGRYGFVLHRPLQLIPVLIGISLISFFLLHAVPGDPIRTLLGERTSPEVVASLRARYGLDQPLLVQYFYYVRNLLGGDLGESIVYKVPISDLLARRTQATGFLLVYSTVLSILVTLPLAVVAALYRGRLPDQIIRGFSTFGLGFPTFWLGLMLIIVFSVGFGWFPVGGYGNSFIEHLHHLFLPSLTIALALSAILIRTMRASLLQTLGADFVMAARAKGLSPRWIFNRHVLRNSLIPAINLLGVNIGWMIGGTVVVETVFSIPGLGQLMVKSIFSRDYQVVQSLTLVFACATVFVSFVVDVITVALDPRISQ